MGAYISWSGTQPEPILTNHSVLFAKFFQIWRQNNFWLAKPLDLDNQMVYYLKKKKSGK